MATGIEEASHDRLVELKEELELLRAFGAEKVDAEDREIEDLLLRIENVMVHSSSADMCKLLRTTGIGRTVNQLTKQPATFVSKFSKKLVSSWKEVFVANLKTRSSCELEKKESNVTAQIQKPTGKTEETVGGHENPQATISDKDSILVQQPHDTKMVTADPRAATYASRQSRSSSTLSAEAPPAAVGMKSRHLHKLGSRSPQRACLDDNQKKMSTDVKPRAAMHVSRQSSSTTSTVSTEAVVMKSKHLQKSSSTSPERASSALDDHKQKMADSKRKLSMSYAKERELKRRRSLQMLQRSELPPSSLCQL
ncbi:hypothetical protein KP509_11G044200 [Ceratopteris richardii]|uniref:TFIIS N-terminal domain-containing protein n=1 Tax=Ceratopteris richardii TaxID=49495 RepID=A0A8T2TTX5_CERRI|nr:hypothetical protein KP509_11G044200 [Ceratopteris richardii]